MQCHKKIADLRIKVSEWRNAGYKIALVPTMGNLHAGHLSLVEQAKRIADKTIVSIFVNPTQFVQGEDYEDYPSTLQTDLTRLEELNADLVFIPTVEEVYPAGDDEKTWVTVSHLDNIFCGKFRPGHFTGVATVVVKLFNIVGPDIAVFGEKDYQQLLVIKKLVADLNFPIEIISGPTVREPDGLALSSRNVYLNGEERQLAPTLYKTMIEVVDRINQGDQDYVKLEKWACTSLNQAGFKTEYFNICNIDDLGKPGVGNLVILAATWLGRARLIDNMIVAHL